ncbi:hypothetical protein ROS9278_02637 [Roseomonas sp. CECT 9278]|nr:hypothetical protein ROS9278_02637 [Roseomonas sp. CECT 9278]
MHEIPLCIDLSIRRACGFFSLAIATVMIALSFDMALALRSGAAMTGFLCCGLLVLAWRSSVRDVRRTEFWCIFAARNPEIVAQADAARLQETARRIWQRRLMWHAERIGAAALALWAGAGIAAFVRAYAQG